MRCMGASRETGWSPSWMHRVGLLHGRVVLLVSAWLTARPSGVSWLSCGVSPYLVLFI